MHCSLLLLLLIFSGLTFAQAPSLMTTTEMCPLCPVPPKCEECGREKGATETYRDDSGHSFLLGYQFVSTWVVGKKAGSYTYIANRAWSFELEYVTAKRTVEIGDFELGKIQEDRYTLFTKYYLNNSFH
jgi:hypothetical protein